VAQMAVDARRDRPVMQEPAKTLAKVGCTFATVVSPGISNRVLRKGGQPRLAASQLLSVWVRARDEDLTR